MATPKVIIVKGETRHYSVGAIIERDGEYLLIERRIPPEGFACIAGHVDEGESPLAAVEREVREESGLSVVSSSLLFDEFIPWNWCSKGVTGHHWYVFRCTTRGAVRISSRETKSILWYPEDILTTLVLEPVWNYWLIKAGILK